MAARLRDGGVSARRKVSTTPAAADKLAAIKAAAVDLFYQHGYHGTEIGDIAAKVNLHHSSLYNYVPSKQELLFILSKEGIDEVSAGLSEVTRRVRDPAERVRAALLFHITWSLNHSALYWLNIVELPHLDAARRRQILQKRDRFQAKWIDIVQGGIDAGAFRCVDAKLVSFGIMGLIAGLTRWYSADGPSTPEELAEYFAGMVLEGL